MSIKIFRDYFRLKFIRIIFIDKFNRPLTNIVLGIALVFEGLRAIFFRRAQVSRENIRTGNIFPVVNLFDISDRIRNRKISNARKTTNDRISLRVFRSADRTKIKINKIFHGEFILSPFYKLVNIFFQSKSSSEKIAG